MSRMISRQEAANMLNVNKQTITNWVEKGIIKGHMVDRTLKVDKRSIERYFDTLKDVGKLEKQVSELRSTLSVKKKELQSTLADICSAQELLGVTIPKTLFRQILQSILAVAGTEVLTPRERDILDLIIEGKPINIIARGRGISRERLITVAIRAARKVMTLKSFSEMRSQNRTLLEENESSHKVIFSLQQRNTELESMLTSQESFVKDFNILKGTEPGHITALLNTPVANVEFTTRAMNCLKGAGIVTLGDLVVYKKSDLLRFRNLGHRSLEEIEETVFNLGLVWGMNVSSIIAIDMQRKKNILHKQGTITNNMTQQYGI